MLKQVQHDVMQSQRPTANVKNMFFCSSVEKRKRKLKACNEKRSGIIRETLSEKAAKVLGRCKTPPAPKTKKCVLWLIVTKKWAVSHQQTAEICLSKHPILPLFQRCAKLHKLYRIDYLCIANNILRFCVFVFWISTDAINSHGY